MLVRYAHAYTVAMSEASKELIFRPRAGAELIKYVHRRIHANADSTRAKTIPHALVAGRQPGPADLPGRECAGYPGIGNRGRSGIGSREERLFQGVPKAGLLRIPIKRKVARVFLQSALKCEIQGFADDHPAQSGRGTSGVTLHPLPPLDRTVGDLLDAGSNSRPGQHFRVDNFKHSQFQFVRGTERHIRSRELPGLARILRAQHLRAQKRNSETQAQKRSVNIQQQRYRIDVSTFLSRLTHSVGS